MVAEAIAFLQKNTTHGLAVPMDIDYILGALDSVTFDGQSGTVDIVEGDSYH